MLIPRSQKTIADYNCTLYSGFLEQNIFSVTNFTFPEIEGLKTGQATIKRER